MFADNKDIIKSDLEKLATMLSMAGICEDTTPIHQAIGHSYKFSKDDCWQYRITNLKFSIKSFSHSIPAEMPLMELHLSVDLHGSYSCDKFVNPLQKMQLDIVIEGYDNDAEYYFASWHFDKHIESTKSKESKLVHPEYHFTFGGTRMWEIPNMKWGSSLILPTPRFAYPPMDGVLGIDFVLGNYIKKDIRNSITRLPEYREIVERSQIRMWRPYFMSISNAWGHHSNFDENMDIDKVMPNLIYLKK